MLVTLACLLISMLAAYGLAVAVVEKGDDWPIRPVKENIQYFLGLIYWRAPAALDCTICLSFWTTLLMDGAMYIVSDYKYFLWPISGFITLGATWTIYEILNAIDNPSLEE